MGLSLGIVGLPNVGKSTLFSALSTCKAEVSNYPFCTINPNVGVVSVPDERLQVIYEKTGAKKAVPTVIEFYDIAGLVRGAHKGEGLGNKFLSHIRDVDAIAHVVRCFAGEKIAHVEGKVDPKRDIETVNLELNLKDLAVIDKQLEPAKQMLKAHDEKAPAFLHLLEMLKNVLDVGKPARSLLPSLKHEDLELIKPLNLLTLKPVLYVANVDESGNAEEFNIINEIAKSEGAKAVAICAKLEAEIAELLPEDARDFLEETGLEEAGLERLVGAGYDLLELIVFFTSNQKECRAWTVKKGASVQQAAGKVHTDMQKGFIAAEVIHYADLIESGSPASAKERGLLHLEGKQYIVQDGDLILIKFNV